MIGITKDFELADRKQSNLLSVIWSTGSSEVSQRTTAIGKHLQVPLLSKFVVGGAARMPMDDAMDDLPGVIRGKKVIVKLKSILYKTVVRTAMVYGSECLALSK